MSEYFYDWGWEYDDNKETAYRKGMQNLHYRVFKHYRDGRIEPVTDTMPKEEAIERCRQILLVDPVGQMDWLDKWHEYEEDKRCSMNEYLRAKGRL